MAADRDVDAEFAAIVARWDDPLRPDPDEPAGRDTQSRDPQNRDPQNRDPQNRDEDGESASGPGGGKPDPAQRVRHGLGPEDGSEEKARRAREPATEPADPATASNPAGHDPDNEPPRAGRRAVDADPLPGAPAPSRPPGDQPDGAPALGGIPVWRGAQLPAEQIWAAQDHEHFTPAPTAPLPPQEDIQFWGIILGLVGGPLLLLWLVLFRPHVSDWWTIGALLLTAGGFVLLVMRQPHSRDENDPDDGAVV